MKKMRMLPLKVFVNGRKVGVVRSAKEYEELLKKVDRSKAKIRLV